LKYGDSEKNKNEECTEKPIKSMGILVVGRFGEMGRRKGRFAWKIISATRAGAQLMLSC
jgi:hypothetical protein